MNRTRSIALTTLVLIASIAPAQTTPPKTTAVILGTVSDTNLRPLGGADVSFAGTKLRIAADSLGRFRVVNVPAGKFLLIVRTIGFQPATNLIEVADDDTLRLAFSLEPSAQHLEAMVVTEKRLSVKLEGFEMRRKAGLGQFFTREDIEARHPTMVVDVLRSARSVRVSSVRGGTYALSAREGNCPMQIYVDGVSVAPTNGMAVDLAFLPPPEQIAAIEVYAGSATLPPWLSAGPPGTKRGCGAILLWTIDG